MSHCLSPNRGSSSWSPVRVGTRAWGGEAAHGLTVESSFPDGPASMGSTFRRVPSAFSPPLAETGQRGLRPRRCPLPRPRRLQQGFSGEQVPVQGGGSVEGVSAPAPLPVASRCPLHGGLPAGVTRSGSWRQNSQRLHYCLNS